MQAPNEPLSSLHCTPPLSVVKVKVTVVLFVCAPGSEPASIETTGAVWSYVTLTALLSVSLPAWSVMCTEYEYVPSATELSVSTPVWFGEPIAVEPRNSW